jgi:hypothetical protein
MHRTERPLRRRKQHGAFIDKSILHQNLPGPVVIVFIAQHEFYFVMWRKYIQIFPAVFFDLARRRRLDIHHPHHARIHCTDIQRAAGLKGDLITGIAKRREQRQTALLRQRLSAGHTNILRAILRDLPENLRERYAFPARKGICGIAIVATQRTTGQANKHRRQTDATGLALQRKKKFADAQLRLWIYFDYLAAASSFFALAAAGLSGYLATSCLSVALACVTAFKAR